MRTISVNKKVMLAGVLILAGAAVSQMYFFGIRGSDAGEAEVVPRILFERQAVISAWIPWQHFDNAVRQIVGPQKLSVDEAVLLGYVLRSDGTIHDYLSDQELSIGALAHRNITLIASVHNERDGARVSRVLSSPSSRGRHIRDLRALAQTEHISGLEIHYERMAAGDRALFSQFIRELAAVLHEDGKTLAVTVHAKTSDSDTLHGAGAQDWQELGRWADSVVVLAYNYSSDTSAPGPIAPSGWVREVSEYALSSLPAERIVLGAAAFGYDWSPHAVPAPNYSLMEIENIIRTTGAEVKRDEATAALYFTYQDESDCPHEVWYEDAHSAQAVAELILERELRGVSIWALGGVTTDYFSVFSDQL